MTTMKSRPSVTIPVPRLPPPDDRSPASFRSRAGLNAANFCLAEVTGVILPFLAKFLADRSWPDAAIPVTGAVAGLGVFLMQTPAGFVVDRVRQRRTLLAASS